MKRNIIIKNYLSLLNKKKILIGFLLFFQFVLVAEDGILIEWDANPESDLSGYRVYAGTTETTEEIVVDVGLQTEYRFTEGQPGVRYYFNIAAYDKFNNESIPATPTSTIFPFVTTPTPVGTYARISYPQDGNNYPSGSTVNVYTAINDPDGIDAVRLWINNQYLDISKTEPYAFTLSGLADGTYDIFIRVSDKFQNKFNSDIITITIGGSSTPTPTPLNQNLVLNGGFESGTAGWNNAKTPWILSTEAIEGSYCIQHDGSGSLNIYQVIELNQYTDYTISAKIKTDIGSTGNMVFDSSDVFDGKGEAQFVHNKHDGTWHQYNGSFNSGSNTSIKIRSFAPTLNGTGYLDDVLLLKTSELPPVTPTPTPVLTPPPTPTPTPVITPTVTPEGNNLLINGDFDDGNNGWSGITTPWQIVSILSDGYSAQNNGGSTKNIYQVVELETYTEYTISASIRIDSGSTGRIVIDTSDIFDAPGQGQFVHSTYDNMWYNYNGTFNSGSITSIKIRSFGSTFNGTGYIDNLVLQKVSTSIPTPTPTSTPTPQTIQNLIINPGFENGTTGWNKIATPWSITTEANTGNNAIKYDGTINKNFNQTISIEANTDYNFSVWIKTLSRAGGIVVVDTSDRFDAKGEGQFVVRTHDGNWQKYSGTFNSGIYTDITIRAFTSQFTGQAWIDDFVLNKQ